MKRTFLQTIQNALAQVLPSVLSQVFAGANAVENANLLALTSQKTRAVATSALLEQIYTLLREQNDEYRHLDSYGNMYIDWDEYLMYFDTFYDEGNLFVICTRAGKVIRIPVTVTDDVPSLGEPTEISLTRTKSRVWIVRDAVTGVRRWVAIAGSAVLNRSGELDSTRLFDSFIARAEASGNYPVLSFYHMPDSLRFGQADHLWREGYLYLQTGTFFDDAASQAVADGLERAASDPNAEPWGVSIGFNSFGDPEPLDIGGGIQIPMYVDGENPELSIVLEQDAAALFTRMSAVQEVNTRMNKATKNKLAQLAGAQIADELETVADGTNRTIEAEGMIARAAADTTAGATAPVASTETPAVAPTVAAAAPVTAPVPAAAVATATAEVRELEIDDALFAGLVAALTESPLFTGIAASVQAIQGEMQTIGTRVGAVETTLGEQRAQTETRLAALETDQETMLETAIQDLPRTTTVIAYRPRERAAVEAAGDPVGVTSEETAQKTLAGIPSKLKPKQTQAAAAA